MWIQAEKIEYILDADGNVLREKKSFTFINTDHVKRIDLLEDDRAVAIDEDGNRTVFYTVPDRLSLILKVEVV